MKISEGAAFIFQFLSYCLYRMCTTLVKYDNIAYAKYQGCVASADYNSNFRTYAAQLYYKYKSKLFNMEECLFAYRFIELSIWGEYVTETLENIIDYRNIIGCDIGGVILLSPVHKKMPDKVFYGKFQNGERIEDVEVSFLGTFQKENYLSKKNMQYVGTITIQFPENPENDFCFFQKQCGMQEVEDGYEVLVEENGNEYKIMIMEKGEIYVRSK